MKHLFPSRYTLALFAAVSLACGTLATLSDFRDFTIAGIAIPVFAFSAWMGMRGSGQWASLARPAK